MAFAAVLARTRGLRTVLPVLIAIEQAHPDLGNALVAWHEHGATASPSITARLAAQARAPLEGSKPPHPIRRQAWALALACLALVLVGRHVVPLNRGGKPAATTGPLRESSPPAPSLPVRWSVTVTPPAYARQATARLADPVRVEALAGSRLDIVFDGWRSDAHARLGGRAVPVTREDARGHVTLIPAASDVLLVTDGADRTLASIALVVVPDASPRVRIIEPAADLRRAQAAGVVPIRIAADDDLGLRALTLRFTQVSGSGESFTFVDGEWPLHVTRTAATAWTASHTLDLAALGLTPGDSVVFQAVARDGRPGDEGIAESERILIEIAKPGAAAGGDASLADPEDRYALSQRMVIQMTERLLALEPRITADDYRRQAQELAMVQRRVRAEFVFMLGGEVEDEFEEAAHSHEVEAGRLANSGQGDLTEAVRQMAQAETRLTAGEVREALPYEYRALAAVQAAFGKARYFMRTLPVPVQVDEARRLQGDRTAAASSRWKRAPLDETQRAAALDVLGRLDSAADDDRVALAALLPAVVAIDRDDAAWVSLAQGLVAGRADDVTRALRARVLAVSPGWMVVPLPRDRRELAPSPRTAARGIRRP